MDHANVFFAVVQTEGPTIGGRRIARQLKPASAADGLSVQIGEDWFRRDANGGFQLHLAIGTDPHAFEAAELVFRAAPGDPLVECEHAATDGSIHNWVLSDVVGEVSGEIRTGQSVSSFSGRGYRDHCFGTAPVGNSVNQWRWGHIRLADRIIAFRSIYPIGHGAVATHDVFEVSPGSRRRLDLVPADIGGGGAHDGSPPLVIDFPGLVRLTRRKRLGVDPLILELYDAQGADGSRGEALCGAFDA